MLKDLCIRDADGNEILVCFGAFIQDLSVERINVDGEDRNLIDSSVMFRCMPSANIGGDGKLSVSLKTEVKLIKDKNPEDVLLILELVYQAAYNLESDDVSEEEMNYLALSVCPQLMYPNVVRIVSNLLVECGANCVILDMVDFNAMFDKFTEQNKE